MVDRKEYFKKYYQEKIKPFRQKKEIHKELKIRCLMCGTWRDLKNNLERDPETTIQIRVWTFGGRADIKVSGLATGTALESYKQIIISKLKLLLRALGEDLEPTERVIETFLAPISRESYNIPFVEDKIPTKESMEVKIW